MGGEMTPPMTYLPRDLLCKRQALPKTESGQRVTGAQGPAGSVRS